MAGRSKSVQVQKRAERHQRHPSRRPYGHPVHILAPYETP